MKQNFYYVELHEGNAIKIVGTFLNTTLSYAIRGHYFYLPETEILTAEEIENGPYKIIF